MTTKEFREVIREKMVPPGNIKIWTFDGCVPRSTCSSSFPDPAATRLERGPDGRFADEDLARLLRDATERRAGAFRARGCPPVMRLVEILAVEQGRKWGVCTVSKYLLSRGHEVCLIFV